MVTGRTSFSRLAARVRLVYTSAVTRPARQHVQALRHRLEDGKRFRSLKRHLGSVYGMTPDEYRAKWGLAKDYPMVAPAYSATRSQLAKKIGLGNKPAARPAAAPTNHVKTEKAPRGRPRKVAA